MTFYRNGDGVARKTGGGMSRCCCGSPCVLPEIIRFSRQSYQATNEIPCDWWDISWIENIFSIDQGWYECANKTQRGESTWFDFKGTAYVADGWRYFFIFVFRGAESGGWEIAPIYKIFSGNIDGATNLLEVFCGGITVGPEVTETTPAFDHMNLFDDAVDKFISANQQDTPGFELVKNQVYVAIISVRGVTPTEKIGLTMTCNWDVTAGPPGPNAGECEPEFSGYIGEHGWTPDWQPVTEIYSESEYSLCVETCVDSVFWEYLKSKVGMTNPFAEEEA